MDILLVSARRSAYTGESISAPHQGLLLLAATLSEGVFHDTAGVDVTVVDDQVLVIERPWAPPSACLSGSNPDIIGVHTTTSSLKNGVKLLQEARHRFPSTLTVLGGVGASSQAESLVGSGAADVVVHGEGEFVFSHLVYVFGTVGSPGFSQVRGITYRGGDGRATTNRPAPAIAELDALPLPARDLVDMDLYKAISRGRSGNLVTSRGCAAACAYCYSRHHWGIGQRRRSVDHVMREVRQMVEKYGLERIRIEDDDLLIDKQWAFEFCDALEATGYHRMIEWEAKARPDEIDQETVERLRHAGCFRLLMGVETLNPTLLRRVSRPMEVDVIENAIRLLHNGGIGVQATLILGLPGETDSAMRYTLSWLEERLGHNSHDITSPCFFVPFTSAVHEAMSRRHEYTIEVADTDCYTGHVPVVSSPACSLEELNLLYEDMTPTRRGRYERIAHLATEREIHRRVAADGVDEPQS